MYNYDFDYGVPSTQPVRLVKPIPKQYPIQTSQVQLQICVPRLFSASQPIRASPAPDWPVMAAESLPDKAVHPAKQPYMTSLENQLSRPAWFALVPAWLPTSPGQPWSPT